MVLAVNIGPRSVSPKFLQPLLMLPAMMLATLLFFFLSTLIAHEGQQRELREVSSIILAPRTGSSASLAMPSMDASAPQQPPEAAAVEIRRPQRFVSDVALSPEITSSPQFVGSGVPDLSLFAAGGVAQGLLNLDAGALELISSVPPTYPLRARRRGIEGEVKVEFTVGTKGRVRDIEVLVSRPSGVFDAAALQAVRRWRFEPYRENGQVREVRASQRIAFQLEKR